ncbi:MAG: serine/threonine-protein kinase [Gemmatimonadaceae bacterium]|nr:serine/threonine-protein kinase [Gemmatimonadaceae bacterium]
MDEPELTPTRLARLESLFDAALSLPETARDSFIDETLPDDPVLAAELRALLDAHALSDSALVSPLHGASDIGDRWTGERLGVFEIGRRIGAGGMGTVYEGVRADDQFRQRVAVKFLRRSTEGGLAVRRFRAERQILANLQHPNIATLIDGGVTPDGVPYFVMEYIDGEPITRWADMRSLTIDERLGLFRQVCAATRAAHQKLVVHRDLKPGNILVAQDGTVKLLDFGIAKLLRDEQVPDLPTATQLGHRAFTPDYASPEQVRGLPVDTTSDIYALGVVLFELLAGVRPFALQGRSLAEIERIICDQPAPRPSSVLGADRWRVLGERSAARARRRIEGDLDAVVLMALRKEPERRYGSVDAMARDITQHLEKLPVLARPEGVGYRLAKFVRRHRLETAAGVVAVLSLIGGTIAATVQARRADAQRIVAEEQGARATELTTFLTTMLNSANPESFGKDITMRAVLDSAVLRADAMTLTPALESEIRDVIGGAYLALGELRVAEQQYLRKLAVLRRRAPGGDESTAITYSQLALVKETNGEIAAADSMLTIAESLFVRFPRSDPRDQSTSIEDRGRVLYKLGRLPEALVRFNRSLDIGRRYYPDSDSSLVPTYLNLTVVSTEAGDLVAADSLSQSALVRVRRFHGESHPLYASALSIRAGVLESLQRMEESSVAYREAIAAQGRIVGERHPAWATSVVNYADHLMRMQAWAEAAQWSRRVLALRGTALDDSSLPIASSMIYLGRALAHLDSTRAGEAMLRQAIALRTKSLPANHWLIASAEGALGEVVALDGRYAEAERLLLAAESRIVAARGPESQPAADVRQRLKDLYTLWKRPAKVAEWQERLVSKRA